MPEEGCDAMASLHWNWLLAGLVTLHMTCAGQRIVAHVKHTGEVFGELISVGRGAGEKCEQHM